MGETRSSKRIQEMENVDQGSKFGGRGKCSKCKKILNLNLVINCEICGLDFHKKCFSVTPHSKKFNYHKICLSCTTTIFPFSNLHGNDFHEALLEFQFCKTKIDLFQSLSETFRINMFNYNCRESSDILQDIDPDQHDNNDPRDDCMYTFWDSIPDKLSAHVSILNFNIRSLKTNFVNLCISLQTTKHKFDVIALTETWINDDDETTEYEIEGYKVIFQNRNIEKTKGGVAIYVKVDTFDVFRTT